MFPASISGNKFCYFESIRSTGRYINLYRNHKNDNRLCIQSNLQLQSNSSANVTRNVPDIACKQHKRAPQSSSAFSLLPIVITLKSTTNSVSRDEDPTTFRLVVPHNPIDRICGAIVQTRTFNALAPATYRLLHPV